LKNLFTKCFFPFFYKDQFAKFSINSQRNFYFKKSKELIFSKYEKMSKLIIFSIFIVLKLSYGGSQTSTYNAPASNSKFPGCTMKWGIDWDGNPNRDLGPWDYVTFWFGAPSCERGAQCTEFNGLIINYYYSIIV